MGAMPNEPSMEEILSSIKRIIAEEDGAAQAPRAPRRAAPASTAAVPASLVTDDHILELTDALPGETHAGPAQEEPAMTPPAKPESKSARAEAPKAEARTAKPRNSAAPAASGPVPGVMSDMSTQAARESLVNLSRLLIRPEDGPAGTLEDLVREMLRPMLKDWLDAHLPGLVETLVKREIDRITGRV